MLRHRFSWKRLSMSAAVGYALGGSDAWLVFQMRPGAYNNESLIEFLTELHDHLDEAELTLIWDGLPSHRSKAMKALDLLPASMAGRGAAAGLCARPQPRRADLGEPEGQRAGQPLPGHHRRSVSGCRRRAATDRRRCPALLGFPAAYRSLSVTRVSLYYANLF